jgi:hypothetical protein
MEDIKIVINNQEYLIKKTNKAIIDFEVMTKRKISEITDSYTDNMTLFYCMLKAANRKTFNYSFDEFLYLLDENEDNIKVFNDYTSTLVEDAEPAKKKN